MKTPTALIIMDGYGNGTEEPSNAVINADTPFLDRLFSDNPSTWLEASGLDVGLPEGQIGNSEVGHTNIGAGRIVFQDLPRISKAITEGSFFENPAYIFAMDTALQKGKSLHLMGLMSDGGVHSHNTHVWALLEMAKQRGLESVYLHCFTDGRDVSPSSGLGYIEECAEMCRKIGIGKIATVSGRFYALDRDSRWERLEKAYSAIVYGQADVIEPDPVKVMLNSYAAGITDEFVIPAVCAAEGTIKDGDSIIFFNFRPDRARELTRALVDSDFSGFDRQSPPQQLTYVCTTQYDASMPNVAVAFPPEALKNTLGEYISSLGMTQLRIAETEKYAHVTFFFNGGSEECFPNEDRVLIASPRDYPTYDLVPEMSAFQVAEKATELILSGEYDVVILNFANCDMVGHTGVYEAAITAVETVDKCVKEVCNAVRELGGIALITADHGNAEHMTDASGEANTAHTTNPVPLAIMGADVKLKNGRLSDIAPTILDLMGLEKPEEMTGVSLIVKPSNQTTAKIDIVSETSSR